MENAATGSGIGQPVRRREDLRLVRGAGRYTADENLPDQAYAVMLRSPHAHARIRAVAKDKALAVPGVLAVLTGADALADGLKPIPHKPWSPAPAEIKLRNSDGSDIFIAEHHLLPADKARFAGEVVAIVVAETVHAAKDGAEAIVIDYDELPAVVATADAARQDAPIVHDERYNGESHRSNVAFDAEVGDAEATAAAFARAAHVTRFDTWIARITGVPMEPRAALAAYDPQTGRYTVYAGNGGSVRLKHDLATILGVPAEQVRVLMGDVGGNFGTRGMIYPEFALVAWAAHKLGRPVKWIIERHEALLGDYQARDLVSKPSWRSTPRAASSPCAARISAISAPTPPISRWCKRASQIMSSIYRMPAAHFRARAVLSNTAPTRPYRSAGRPEVIYIMERLIDLAAREHGFDRVALRRRNLIPEQELPYHQSVRPRIRQRRLYRRDGSRRSSSATGRASRSAAPRQESAAAIAASASPITSTPRPARRTRRPRSRCCRKARSISWSACRRRARATRPAFAQLVNEWLGVPIETVRFIAGDTDRVSVGGGAHAGRGLRMASIVIKKSADMVIAKALRIAEHLLETAAADIEFKNGRFTVKGTNHGIGLFEVARAAAENTALPDELRGPLAAAYDEIITAPSFPYGAHVCEVEVDPETGVARVVNYVAVDDVGRAVNPLVVHGQVHGGIAQGFGQAMMENVHYDSASGQMLAASFMDYAMPRASDLPFYTTELSEIPATSHPLGIRPAGEGGTVPALGVIVNAIVDALSEFGVRHIEMPATPDKVWQAIRDARNAG